MRQHLSFLETSSAVVKVAAWIFLLAGASGSLYIFLGKIGGRTFVDGAINLAASIFFFFLFYLIAKIADLLILIINDIHKEKDS